MLGNIIIYLVHLCYRPLFLALLIEVDQRQDKKFRQGFIGSLSATVGSENKQVSLAGVPLSWGMSWSRGQAGGRLRWSAQPLTCRGHVQHPTFASGSFEVASGFWLLRTFCPEFVPTARACGSLWSHTACACCPGRAVSQCRRCSAAARTPAPGPPPPCWWSGWLSSFPLLLCVHSALVFSFFPLLLDELTSLYPFSPGVLILTAILSHRFK